MNEEVKKTWIEALRSGDYKQGKFSMKNEHNEYCCLGVLGCLYAKAHNLEWDEKLLTEQSNVNIAQEINKAPSDLVYNWAGLKKSHLGYNNPNIIGEMTLAELNDNKGYSFEKIANLIENHL